MTRRIPSPERSACSPVEERAPLSPLPEAGRGEHVLRCAGVYCFALGLTAANALAQAPGSAPAKPPEKAPQGFFEILFSGGPVGVIIMLVLIGLSLTAAYLFFEQLLVLRRSEIMPDGLGENVRQLLLGGRVKDADQVCRAQPSVLSFVLLYGLSEVDNDWAAIEKALEDATAQQSARLFRKVEYLAVIGNIAPMVGLLGTVTGMIMAFQQVANTKGSAGAADLAEGIYQALVTTVVGLVIAIPSLGAFAVLRNQLDQLIAETAYLALHVFAPLKRRRIVEKSPAPPPAPPPPPEPRK